MTRTSLTAAMLTAALTVVSIPAQAFDFFGLFSKNDLNDMLPYIPADTAIFAGGTANEELIEDMEGWLNPAMSQAASDDLADLFEQMPDSSGLAFFQSYMVDYYANAAQGMDAMYDIYGLKRDGASVFYLDGIYPVMRLALADVDTFKATLTKSANDSGYEMSSTELNGEELTVFELVNEDELQLNLGMMFHNETLTLGFYSSAETNDTLVQRFALSKRAQPMTKADWSELGDTLELDDYMRGYVSLTGLADIFLNSDTSGAKQLSALLPMPAPSDNLSPSCRAETAALIAGVPRITFGTQGMATSGELLTMSLASLLEIEYTPVLSELQKLVGFVPDYLTSNDDLTLGMGLGLNMDNLVPALTSVWTQFILAEFDCEYLQMAQQQLQQANPAMLSLVTGFAKGVKGVSAGVFNYDAGSAGMNYDIDALVTLSADDPSLITSLLATYLPFEPGQTITDGGDPIALPLPIPVEAFIAQRGQHLVVYSGDQSKAEAEKLSSVKVSANGLSAITLDYQNLGDLMINSAQTLTEMNPDSEGDCTEMFVAGLMLKNMDLRLSGRDVLTENGWSSQYTFVMNPMTTMQASNVDLPGTYLLEYMDYDCSWYESGIETINADGTGSYTDVEDGESCPMWKSTYEWDETLGLFSQFNSDNYYRDECDQDWMEDEPFDFECMITAAENGNFYCLETYDGEQTLYRYTKQ